jgi:hypothetical protein
VCVHCLARYWFGLIIDVWLSVCIRILFTLLDSECVCSWWVIFLANDMLILVDKLWIEGLLFDVDRMVFVWDPLFCVVWPLVIRSCILEKLYVDLFGYPCVYRRIFLRSEYVTPVLLMADYWWISVGLDYMQFWIFDL